ncbi:MAG TPA: cytochrome c [Kofleriaceae bacterium]|nr:cytochrome c [Kofleriaceae bacterium]
MRLALPCLLLLAACGTDVREEPDPPAPKVTWHQDVAPIVAKHCMGCHQDGGIGPFDLTTYESASENAGNMLDKIEKGVMPPFDAREEADCTPRYSWKDDPRLSDTDIATIQQWIADGTPEGTVAPLPPLPETSLPGITKTLKPIVPFTAAGNRDQFICYVLDPNVPNGAWLTGLQIRPGNDLVVHHVVLTEITPSAETDALVAQRGIGVPWDCDQTGTPGAFVVNIWTPGNEPMQTSNDLAVPLVANSKLVMNIHYHPAGGIHQPDATEVDLRTSTAWPKKMYFVTAFGNEFQAPNLLADPDDRLTTTPEFRIPANKALHTEHMRTTIPSLGNLTDVRLYSANPHMHMIGTHISAHIERPAPRLGQPQNECLANGNWNFDWQRTYIYDAPLDQLPSVAEGDVIDLKCNWNNTMDNPFVQRALVDAGLGAPIDINLGEGSLDEMCLEIFGIAIDAPAQPLARPTQLAPSVEQLPLELLDAMRVD